MKRLMPKSLVGQMLLLIAAALFVAQTVNFAFILNERQKLSLAQNEGPAIDRFATVAAQVYAAPPVVRQAALAAQRSRGASFAAEPASIVDRAGLTREGHIESRLENALKDAGLSAGSEVRGARSLDVLRFRPSDMRRNRGQARSQQSLDRQVVLLSVRLPDRSWLNGRIETPRPDPWLIARLVAATLILYALVFGAALWIAARLARPMRDLTLAAERFQGREDVQPVEPRGPSDIRRAVEAFNGMNRRMVALLDEKDRMLGAIGHDLRTPLASIRIRIEAMGPDEDRERVAATIDEMTATLEDILVLARTGRAREPVRLIDISALAEALTEEFVDTGQDARFEESLRAPVEVQPNLLRRGIRNLIDNAVKYGRAARVRVVTAGQHVRIEIDDEGPGIPPDRLADVLKPFERLESSRSRDTGGAGLGLAIAQAVAQAHGGELVLTNLANGFRASLILPR